MEQNSRTNTANSFGPNDWLAEEMLELFLKDPNLVPASWREFFSDSVTPVALESKILSSPESADGIGEAVLLREVSESVAAGMRASEHLERSADQGYQIQEKESGLLNSPQVGVPTSELTVAQVKVKEEKKQEPKQIKGAVALRGVAGKVVENMVSSLDVPTATSVREVPARLLEVNRTMINDHLVRMMAAKVSFTHIISYAIVKAVETVPQMNSTFVENFDGKGTPGVIRHEVLNLGVAVDVPRKDGGRALYVPVLRGASEMSFAQFASAYDALIKKVRANKISPDDFTGATMTITNPGTIGTSHSVPRLMSGQGTIVGVGSITYGADFQASDPMILAELGISKTVTMTSTYDHRIIQGAESGLFLKTIDELLRSGAFYQSIFDSLEVPYPAVEWSLDTNDSIARKVDDRLVKQVHVQTLINNYRVRGHLMAKLDPLDLQKPVSSKELDPKTYGLSLWDLSREFYADGLAGYECITLEKIMNVLRDAYCRTVGIEYMHIQDPDEKRWIQNRVEGVPFDLSKSEKLRLLERLNAAEAFEKFLSTRYIGHKRFGLEGAESAIAFLDEVLTLAAANGLPEAVLGMAHRGRLNVLANIVGKSYSEIFREFEGNLDPASVQGSGDVKYHKGYLGTFEGRDGVCIDVTLSSNPSHLEAVDPVVEGVARAKEDLYGNVGGFPVLPILVHGDAAFAGQGVVVETLNLSQLRGYRTGGTVHLVINNQVGFTTNPNEARSSIYASDVAKTVQAPIFHVNGDDPESVVRVARLAFEYRQTFHKDVVVDMICYRRHGHNEGDEPSYTHPLMYGVIEGHPSVRKLYTKSLSLRNEITEKDEESALEDFLDKLQRALDETRSATSPNPTVLPPPRPLTVPLDRIDTGVPKEALDLIAERLITYPTDFTVHPKLERLFAQRDALYRSGEVDWSMGEHLAFGSLLLEGKDIRFAGQDSRRGTFSHRHASLIDNVNGQEYFPLMTLRDYEGPQLRAKRGGRFMIYDSLLSEYAALGFEYGYSLIQTDALVCWEAQFGDFANGAQIIIDQFITAAEDKWGQHSGLVMLLPHGYEGQGAEHSSARLERFLVLASGGNMAVVYPTTSSQIFHLFRSQVHRSTRRPLIVASPKSLLRSKNSRSPIEEFVMGSFRPIIDDDVQVVPELVERVVFCSGKVAFEAMALRDSKDAVEGGIPKAAIIRLEQLFPWPEVEIEQIFSKYYNAKEVVWLQEEPANMGAWSFVHERLHSAIRLRFSLRHVSRPSAGSPATGFSAMHLLEQEDLLRRALFEPIKS